MDRAAAPRYYLRSENLASVSLEQPETTQQRTRPQLAYQSPVLSPFDEPSELESESEDEYTCSRPLEPPSSRYEYNSKLLNVLNLRKAISPLKDRNLCSKCSRHHGDTSECAEPQIQLLVSNPNTPTKHQQIAPEGIPERNVPRQSSSSSPSKAMRRSDVANLTASRDASYDGLDRASKDDSVSATDEAGYRILGAGSRRHVLVNHYPYPERHHNVVCAIATADRALGSVGTTPNSNLSSPSEGAKCSSVVNNVMSLSQSSDVAATDEGSKPYYPVDSEGHNTRNPYPNGGGHGSYQPSRNQSDTSGSNWMQSFATGPFNTANQNLFRSNEPDPGDTPATLASLETTDQRRFPCVYHRPTNSQLDPTKECATFHKYVSQLRVHHGGNRHSFYYCTTCITRFSTEAERKNHGKCNNHRCVTETCPNFDTLNPVDCNHPGDGHKNSQWSIWRALFRLAHPGLHPPELDLAQPTPSSAVLTPSVPHTPAMFGSRQQTQTPVHPGSKRNRLLPHLDSRRVVDASTMESISPREQHLRLLARALVSQLDQPDPEGLEVLRDMYDSYMEDASAVIVDASQCPEKRSSIKGLLHLNRRLWTAVQEPDSTSQHQINQLRMWADGVICSKETPCVPSVTTTPLQQTTHEPQSPTVAVAGRVKGKQRQIQHSADMDFDYGAQHFDFMESNPPSFGEISNAEYEMLNTNSDDIDSFFVVPGRTDQTPNLTAMTSFFPFTQRDSAAAIQTPRSNRKTPRMTDSGYGTGNHPSTSRT